MPGRRRTGRKPSADRPLPRRTHETFAERRDRGPEHRGLRASREEGCETFDGPFSAFALAFVRRLLDVDRYHGIAPEALEYLGPEDLEELVAAGEVVPVRPSFEPF